MRRTWIVLTALGAVSVLGACKSAEMPQAADGRALYQGNCAICHGPAGRGDGPMARDLEKAPKDLTLIALRYGDGFPRAQVMSLIDGYARSDVDRPGMPEFGALLEGDLIPFDSGDGRLTPTPRKLVALLEYIESLQQGR